MAFRILLFYRLVQFSGCGLFVGVFGGARLQNPYAVAGALNGAVWGLLVAYDGLKAPRRVAAR